ncbi:MAG: NADH-quinone oxidoreductase subunit N [Elusimicrobia bacterium]|nr:NADH-quinone oxidoreductase subunit N [Elusimicrobiota bacterium]
MRNLGSLLPELGLSVLGLGLMLADILTPPRLSRSLYHLAWAAAAAALGLVAWGLYAGPVLPVLGTLWTVDPMSQFFKMLLLVSTLMTVMLVLEYGPLPPAQAGTFSALLVFSVVGMMVLVSAGDLLLIFVSLELVSISSFVLAGFERGNRRSNEGAVKYFLFGAFSSALMVYGISLYYGTAGTTRLVDPASAALLAPGLQGRGGALTLAMLFILLGFGFKAALAPMHFWVPDAYEGAPLPVTAFLSVAPKIATIGALVRVYMCLQPAAGLGLTALLALLAMLTMTIGNTVAIFQDNVKRLLAYSSIAQAGYILIGIVAGNALGAEGILLYCLVYVAMNLGAFAVVQAVGDDGSRGGLGSYQLEAFDGLGRRSFALALIMTLFLLSLAGLPPLAGFIAKFYLFASALDAGRGASGAAAPSLFYGLAVVAVLNSVVSVYYYMKIAYHMFFLPPRGAEGGPGRQAPRVGPYVYGCIFVALAGVLYFGVYPDPLIANVKLSAPTLP